MRAPSALIAVLAALLLAMAAPASDAAELPVDPLNSPMWRDIAAKHLAGGPVVMDERVKVVVPAIVERQAQVPITVDARAVPGVAEVIVLADLNPIQHVLTLRPLAAAPYVSVRVKIEQGTPIRAAAKTADGVWHVGSVYLDAAGGGCTAPAMARGEADWAATVGRTQGRVWREADGLARVRMRVRHPMDTGLGKDNTPAFFIDKLTLSAKSGTPLLEIESFEPVSEDPTLTVLVALPNGEAGVDLTAHDNNGGLYRSFLPAPWKQSALQPATGKP